MHPSKKFDFAFLRGIINAIRIWSGFRPGRIIKLWKHYRILQKATDRRIQLYKTENLVVPPLLILSPTMQCNLSCAGCYSREYSQDNEMNLEEINSLFTQSKELGISFFVITGGEPLLRRGLIDLLAEHPDVIFFLFTNSIQINPAWAKNIKNLSHIIPILSIEGNEKQTDQRRAKGTYQQVMNSMAYLKTAGIFFGFSIMVTSRNLAAIGEEAFIDSMIAKGCRIGYYVGYVPSAKDADISLVPSKEQQKWLHQRIVTYQRGKSIIIIHMPDDEYDLGGTCMAAGKGFLHINAQGYVEPCPFAHLASDSVRTTSLKKVLQSPFFKYIRDHSELLTQPQMGCALFERRKELNAIAKKFGAKPTD